MPDSTSPGPMQAPATQQPPAHYSYAQPQPYPPPGGLPYSQGYAGYPSYPPKVIPISRPWHIAKIVLGSLSLVTSTVLLGVAIAMGALYSGLSYGVVDVIMATIIAGVAMIWQIAESITICARGGRRGIHPGAHVALHLLIVLGAILTMSFEAVFLAEDAQHISAYNDACYFGYCGYSSVYINGYFNYSDATTYFSLEATIVAFTAILAIIHLILFVRACVETHQRNRSSNTIIIMPSAPGMQPMNGGYYMPQPPQMAHMSYAPPPMPMQQQHMPVAPATSRPISSAADGRASMLNPTQPERTHALENYGGYYAPPANPGERGPTVTSPVAANSAVSASSGHEAPELDTEARK